MKIYLKSYFWFLIALVLAVVSWWLVSYNIEIGVWASGLGVLSLSVGIIIDENGKK